MAQPAHLTALLQPQQRTAQVQVTDVGEASPRRRAACSSLRTGGPAKSAPTTSAVPRGSRAKSLSFAEPLLVTVRGLGRTDGRAAKRRAVCRQHDRLRRQARKSLERGEEVSQRIVGGSPRIEADVARDSRQQLITADQQVRLLPVQTYVSLGVPEMQRRLPGVTPTRRCVRPRRWGRSRRGCRSTACRTSRRRGRAPVARPSPPPTRRQTRPGRPRCRRPNRC